MPVSFLVSHGLEKDFSGTIFRFEAQLTSIKASMLRDNSFPF